MTRNEDNVKIWPRKFYIGGFMPKDACKHIVQVL